MSPSEPFLSRAARWLTFASAACILFSIAASQILLALALAALLLSGDKLRLPRIKWPLALFMLGTVISLAFSADPAAGLPQIRKFYVFSELLVVFSCLRAPDMPRWLFLTWAGFSSITAIRGFAQFAGKVQQAHALGQNFYDYYVGERITGFTSHWNTFSAEEMFALIMLGAFLFFAPVVPEAALGLGAVRLPDAAGRAADRNAGHLDRHRRGGTLPAVVLESQDGAAGAGRGSGRHSGLAAPFANASNPWSSPAMSTPTRFAWSPGAPAFRMIEAHPWLGIGPEGVKYHFDDWVPPDVPRPLPAGWYGHLHNIYLQYAAERGIPTMLVMMWLLVQILVDFWRGLRSLPPGRSDRRFLLHGGIAVVLATLAEGFVEYNLGDSEVLTMFLVVVACGYLALEKPSRPRIRCNLVPWN